jgi:hypothetical protein
MPKEAFSYDQPHPRVPRKGFPSQRGSPVPDDAQQLWPGGLDSGNKSAHDKRASRGGPARETPNRLIDVDDPAEKVHIACPLETTEDAASSW